MSKLRRYLLHRHLVPMLADMYYHIHHNHIFELTKIWIQFSTNDVNFYVLKIHFKFQTWFEIWNKFKWIFKRFWYKELLNNYMIWIQTFSLSYLLDLQRPTKENRELIGTGLTYLHSVWIIKISCFLQFLSILYQLFPNHLPQWNFIFN